MQSIATAEIVPLACISLKELLELNKCKSLIINTVHDSIVVDVHPDEITTLPKLLKQAMLSVSDRMLYHFNLSLDVPMEVDLKIGDDWLDMEEIYEDKHTQQMEERTVPLQQTTSLHQDNIT